MPVVNEADKAVLTGLNDTELCSLYHSLVVGGDWPDSLSQPESTTERDEYRNELRTEALSILGVRLLRLRYQLGSPEALARHFGYQVVSSPSIVPRIPYSDEDREEVIV